MSPKTRNVLSIIEILLFVLSIIFMYLWEIYSLIKGQHVMYDVIMILVTSGFTISVILNGKIAIYHDKNRNNSSK